MHARLFLERYKDQHEHFAEPPLLSVLLVLVVFRRSSQQITLSDGTVIVLLLGLIDILLRWAGGVDGLVRQDPDSHAN